MRGPVDTSSAAAHLRPLTVSWRPASESPPRNWPTGAIRPDGLLERHPYSDGGNGGSHWLHKSRGCKGRNGAHGQSYRYLFWRLTAILFASTRLGKCKHPWLKVWSCSGAALRGCASFGLS